MRAGAERFPWVEIFRGLAILEVLLHHVSGRFLRLLPQEGEAWLLLASLNRTLHFAVPGFLFLTTAVLGASLLREVRLGKYIRNRALRLLWPYLLWSGFYLLWRYLEYPHLFDPSRIPHQLLWGKAYFHLYFLVLALQLTLLLPLLRPLLLRRLPFWAWALGGILFTLGFYLTNRYLYRLPYPGSLVLWYAPAIALGLYVAQNLPRLSEPAQARPPLGGRHRRGKPGPLPPSGAFCPQEGGGQHRPLPGRALALHHQRGLPPPGPGYHLGQRRGRLKEALGFLGRYSLQIYLVHPLIIRILEIIPSFPEPLGFKPAFLIYLGLALLLPLALARLASRLKLSIWLFGR